MENQGAFDLFEGTRSQVYHIVYSHGNATDLGGMFSRYVYIAVKLGVNVVGYDYTGYGVSDGMPTEKQTYMDIEAVFKWCLSTTSSLDELFCTASP